MKCKGIFFISYQRPAGGYRNCVVIDEDHDSAKNRAYMMTGEVEWETADVSLIEICRSTRTNRVLAMDQQ